jgi:UDP:flavonoid glycosyltransferase YjiC (YdhE family)
MARIALTWQLGSGVGHVASLSVLSAALAQDGHEVVAVLRDPQRGEPFFASHGARCLQAPLPSQQSGRESPTIATYADLLAASGFDAVDELSATVSCWDELFSEICPDVVVMDHSPTALVCGIGASFRKVLHSPGFFIPPAADPLPVLRPWLVKNQAEAKSGDDRVRDNVNTVLERRGRSPLKCLADLYSQVEETFLASYEELDHFAADRVNAKYWGIVPPPTGGIEPNWPDVAGPRVFIYLWPSTESVAIVDGIAKLGHPTIVRMPGSGDWQSRWKSSSVRVVAEPVAMEEMARQCDVAVLHGGHGTMAAMLLAGKPLVLVPFQLEQLLQAQRCAERDLAICVAPNDYRNIGQAIHLALTNDKYHSAARAFSERYRSMEPSAMLSSLVQQIGRLAV